MKSSKGKESNLFPFFILGEDSLLFYLEGGTLLEDTLVCIDNFQLGHIKIYSIRI